LDKIVLVNRETLGFIFNLIHRTSFFAAQHLLYLFVKYPFCSSDFIIRFQPNESPIKCVSPSQDGFWVACGNGRCSLYNLTSRDSLPDNYGDNMIRLELKCELTGPDCDPVYGVIESSDRFVYTACRDGVVRKYKIK